jgi:hypothetical protein
MEIVALSEAHLKKGRNGGRAGEDDDEDEDTATQWCGLR